MRDFKDYSDMEITTLVEGMKAGNIDYTMEELKETQAEVVNRHLNTRYAGILSDLMRSEIINSEQTGTMTDKTTSETVQEPVATSKPTPLATDIPMPIGLTLETELPSGATPPPPPPAFEPSFDTFGATLEVPTSELTTPPPIIPAFDARRLETPITDSIPKAKTSESFDKKYKTLTNETTTLETETDFPVFKFLSGLFSALPWISLLGIYGLYAYEILAGRFAGDFNFLVFGGIGSVILSFVILIGCLYARENLIWKMNVAKNLGTPKD